MKLFKTPTREPALYVEEDPAVLRKRIRELEEVVEKYRTDRIPPFDVDVKIHATSWASVVWIFRELAARGERHGPDFLAGSGGGDSLGNRYSVKLTSGKHVGPGEVEDDMTVVRA